MLHTEGVISEEIATEIEQCGCMIRGHQLIALCFALTDNHGKMERFTEILLRTKEAISLANEIAQGYG